MFEDYEVTQLPTHFEYKPLFPKYHTAFLSYKNVAKALKILAVVFVLIFVLSIVHSSSARTVNQPVIEGGLKRPDAPTIRKFVSDYFGIDRNGINEDTVLHENFGIPQQTIKMFYKDLERELGLKVKNQDNIYTVGDLLKE